MNYSNPVLLRFRRAGQKLGILKPFVRLYRKILKPNYEESFDNEVLRHVQTDCTVWDVGANAGHYTTKFAAAVGSKGVVVAFEPAPQTFEVLQRSFGKSNNIKLERIALGDHDGSVDFYASDREEDPTNGLLPIDGRAAIKVPMFRGDSYQSSNPALTPNCVKIDVEGFEYEVLSGLTETLKLSKLQTVGVEVHFEVLNTRNLGENPAKIELLLRRSGFLVRWVDPSHIVATRKS